MTLEEMKTSLITEYCNLQRIKNANNGHENKELDYQIKEVTAKLASLSVNVEELTL